MLIRNGLYEPCKPLPERKTPYEKDDLPRYGGRNDVLIAVVRCDYAASHDRSDWIDKVPWRSGGTLQVLIPGGFTLGHVPKSHGAVAFQLHGVIRAG